MTVCVLLVFLYSYYVLVFKYSWKNLLPFNNMPAFSFPGNLSQPSVLSLFLEDFLYYDSVFNAVCYKQSTIPATIIEDTNIKQARQQSTKQYNQEEIKHKFSLWTWNNTFLYASFYFYSIKWCSWKLNEQKDRSLREKEGSQSFFHYTINTSSKVSATQVTISLGCYR